MISFLWTENKLLLTPSLPFLMLSNILRTVFLFVKWGSGFSVAFAEKQRILIMSAKETFSCSNSKSPSEMSEPKGEFSRMADNGCMNRAENAVGHKSCRFFLLSPLR